MLLINYGIGKALQKKNRYLVYRKIRRYNNLKVCQYRAKANHM